MDVLAEKGGYIL